MHDDAGSVEASIMSSTDLMIATDDIDDENVCIYFTAI